MSKLTDILGLFKYDPETDGANTFNITQALNNNWDKIDQLVLLAVAAAAAYDPEGSYAVGAYCTHGGKLHKCGTAIPDGEAWTAEHWTETTVAAELAEVRASLLNKLEIHSNNSAGLDCNLLINDGRYQMQGQLVNSPPWNNELAGHFFIDVFHHADNWVRQVAYEVTSDQVYTRSMLDYTWGKWLPFSTATPPQEHAIVPKNGATLIDGFKNSYSKDQFGRVAVFFSLHFDALPVTDSEIFSLPESFRPSGGNICGSAYLAYSVVYPAGMSAGLDGSVRITHNSTDYVGPIHLHGFLVIDTGGTQ